MEATPLSELVTPPTEAPPSQPVATPEPAPQPEPQPAAEPVAQPEPEQPRGPDGKFLPKQPEATQEPKADVKPAAVDAVIAERRRRQEIERQNAALQAELVKYQQQQPPQPPPDMFGQPEQWQAHIRDEIRKEQVNGYVAMAQAMVPEYDTLWQAVSEAAQTNPALEAQVMSAANPAAAVIHFGRQIIEARKREEALKEIGDPASFKERIRQEILAELQTQQPAPAAPAMSALSLPPSLANARSVASRGQPVAFSHAPLSDLVNRKPAR